MKKMWLKNSLVCGIIVLFFGTSIIPANTNITAENFSVVETNCTMGILNTKTLYVDNDSTYPGNGSMQWPYRYIWQGIENASDGDTVFVFNGSYDNPFSNDVTVNKYIHLLGENKNNTLIRGNLIVTGDLINIRNFTIGAGITGRGLSLETCNNCTIADCFSQYLYMNNSNGNEVKNCGFSTPIKNIGTALYNCKNNILIENTFQADSFVAPNYGLVLENSDDNDIIDNICKASTSVYSIPSVCIWLKSSKDNQIINNICSESDIGIQITNSEHNTIHYNTIKSNAIHGIKMESSSFDNTISNNTIEENFNGIWFTNTSMNIVEHNNIKDNNNISIFLSYSYGDKIHYNNIYSVVKLIILWAQFSYSSATWNYWYSPLGPFLRNFRLFFGFVQLRPFKHGEEYQNDCPG